MQTRFGCEKHELLLFSQRADVWFQFFCYKVKLCKCMSKVRGLQMLYLLLSQMMNGTSLYDFACVFWDYSLQDWSTDGCSKRNASDGVLRCFCNHTTNFAALWVNITSVHWMLINFKWVEKNVVGSLLDKKDLSCWWAKRLHHDHQVFNQMYTFLLEATCSKTWMMKMWFCLCFSVLQREISICRSTGCDFYRWAFFFHSGFGCNDHSPH